MDYRQEIINLRMAVFILLLFNSIIVVLVMTAQESHWRLVQITNGQALVVDYDMTLADCIEQQGMNLPNLLACERQ